MEESWHIMNKNAGIVIILIAHLLIGGFLIFNSSSDKETTTGTPDTSAESPISEYQNIQSFDDVFNSIDDSLNYIE